MADTQKAKTRVERLVTYKAGMPGLVRNFTSVDWERFGVKHGDVSFDSSNNHSQQADDWPAAVVAYFKADPDFKVTEHEVDVKEEGPPKP